MLCHCGPDEDCHADALLDMIAGNEVEEDEIVETGLADDGLEVRTVEVLEEIPDVGAEVGVESGHAHQGWRGRGGPGWSISWARSARSTMEGDFVPRAGGRRTGDDTQGDTTVCWWRRCGS